MNEPIKKALNIVQGISIDIPCRYVPPSLGASPESQMVLPHSIVSGTRGYIEIVTKQINGAYEKGWYDACAVMVRRLLEMLIIECFEYHNLSHEIKNNGGNFMYLSDLIRKTLGKSAWNLGRNSKKALPKLKDIGDQSAHSRRFNATREDIDKIIGDLRTVAQELVYLAQFQ